MSDIHIERKAGIAEFSLNHCDSVMGRLTIPFRSQMQQEIENLTRKLPGSTDGRYSFRGLAVTEG